MRRIGDGRFQRVPPPSLRRSSAAIQCAMPRLQVLIRRVSGTRGDRHDADGVMRRTRNLLLFPLLGAIFLMAGVALAREISMQEATAQAQREVDGKVLSVQTLNVGKRKIYRIKVLTHDGRVRVVQVPAEK